MSREPRADPLRCPRCGEPLDEEETTDRVVERLGCANGHSFPVVGGIARFTPPSSYADSFGYEWTRFPRLQLDSGNRKESEEAFAEKTGLTPGDVQGRSVLDGGCGMGRFSDVVARWGAERVVSLDISRAVESAARNLEAYDSVRVVQADLRNPPLAERSFDVVFSLGVLHHTPDTRAAFDRLARYVKPGGIYCVWVYSREVMRSQAGGEVLRLGTRRMKPDRLLRLVEWSVPRIYLLRRRFPAIARPLQVALPISLHPDPDWRILDTFDWYSPRYQWKHTFEEVEGWFAGLGFEGVSRQPFPVAVSGRRPLG